MFNHNLRLLSFVPRWQIAPRFRTQSVAEHSYFVALYTMQLVGDFKWHWPTEKRMEALRCAILHDAAEARTGDSPGPVKRATSDPERRKAYETEQLALMGINEVEFDQEVLDLVKVADLIDEYFHVAEEISMGNSLIERQLPITQQRLWAAIRKAHLPFEVQTKIEEEVSAMRSGYQLPENTHETDPLTPAPLDYDGTDEIPF